MLCLFFQDRELRKAKKKNAHEGTKTHKHAEKAGKEEEGGLDDLISAIKTGKAFGNTGPDIRAKRLATKTAPKNVERF